MNKFNTVRLPQLAWFGDTELELQFPKSWDVHVCYMQGYSAPALSEEQLRQAFANPIGTPRIRDLAKGKNEVVILFDDTTRPTKVSQLVPYILQELEEAGIPDDNIRFIPTLGNHAVMKRPDLVKKLGEKVLDRFAVYNHNCYENCTYLGKTSRGTPVEVNSEVMSCDLKIAIGGIIPHSGAGFGGGAKAILPGVSSKETTWVNHRVVGRTPDGQKHHSSDKGKVDENVLRLDMEEAARMAGLDIIVNVVINGKRDPVGLFVGDLVAAHREGVKLGREIYAAKPVKDVDIVISNNYSCAASAALVDFPGSGWYKKGEGSLVHIANTPEGQIIHYVSSSFGKNIGGRGWKKPTSLPRNVNKLIVFAPYPDRSLTGRIAPPESFTWAKTWLEVLEELRAYHQGEVKVAVIPDVKLQYFPE
ncbi:nickel-dependent lactate racemase [Chloroflexota bacterium]